MTTSNGLHEWRQAAYRAAQERDQARRKLDRIGQMATAWEQQLPDTIRTAVAVEALRAVIQEQR